MKPLIILLVLLASPVAAQQPDWGWMEMQNQRALDRGQRQLQSIQQQHRDMMFQQEMLNELHDLNQ
jgi:hypothetical protein